MKHKAAFRVFLVISLALMLTVPAINLSDRSARTNAQRLISQKKTDGLVQMLFNSDFMMARLSALTWRTGLSTSPANVVVGRKGWLYLGDAYDNNTSAHRFGESAKDVRMAQGMGENLLAWHRWLGAQGVKGFVMVIGADKNRIYSRHLPNWVNLQRPARIRGLLEGPAHTLIADPSPELLRLSADDAPHTYDRSDTHWNMWGAAISLETLRQTLTKQGLRLNWALPSPPAIDHSGTRIGGDLAFFLRIQGRLTEQEPHPTLLNRDVIKSDVRELDTGNPLKAGDFGQLQYPGHTVQVVTEGAANDLKVLWLRDSFGSAQSPLMAANFRETIQLHWGRALGKQARLFVDLVREQKPDLVVITVVERSLPSNLFLVPPPQE